MISTDRAILTPGSAVSERMKEYGNLVDRLDIVLLSDKRHGLKDTQLSEGVSVYPTNSFNKFLRSFDAVDIGEKIAPDIITAQDPFECGWAGLKLKNEKHIPLEVQLHTNPFSPQFGGLLNLVRKMMAKSVYKEADAIRVVLGSVKQELVKRGINEQKISVLPIYIDRRRIDGEPKFDLHEKYGFKNVVLAVSRISAEKNIGLAIEAVSQIPDTGLIVVGDGPERKKFNESGKVKFAGWQESLSSFYKTADIFIQTSDFEGYGLSLVEAGLSGLPVVSTPVGVANDLENISIGKTSDEFKTKISELLENRERARAIGRSLQAELEAVVLTKESYLVRLKENWQKLAQKKI